jgi:DNA-binding response OmpR family regulator
MANVLVIDDDPSVTQLLTMHLSDEGHKVRSAHRGQEGLDAALKEPPDLILLDVMLPDITGFQLCTKLRRSTETKRIPIIMMTGVARYPNQRAFAMERGADEYLLKPFEILHLGELVQYYTGPQRTNYTH